MVSGLTGYSMPGIAQQSLLEETAALFVPPRPSLDFAAFVSDLKTVDAYL